jgi:FlaA1/EpsC-like NDP-sugar epimerase
MVLPIDLSGSILVLYVILIFNLLVLTRSSFHTIRRAIGHLAAPSERVVVVGAGRIGSAAVSYLFSERRQEIRLVGFIDDDGFKLGKLVHGQRVLGSSADLERVYHESPFDQILIAAENINDEKLKRIGDFAHRHELVVRRFTIALNDVRDGGPTLSIVEKRA